jgi:hypothetical protein
LVIGRVVAADVRTDEPPLTLVDGGWHYSG